LKQKYLFRKLDQKGFDHLFFLFSFVAVFVIVGVFFIIKDYADTIGYQFKLEYANKTLCIDDFGDSKSPGSIVAVYTCKSTDNAQVWTLNHIASNEFYLKTTNGSDICIEAGKGIGVSGHRIYATTATCNTSGTSAASRQQLWGWSLAEPSELKNVASGGCLNDAANGGSDTPLIIFACQGTTNERWYQTAVESSTTGSNDGNGTTVSGEAKALCEINHYPAYECDAVGDAVSQVSTNYSGWVSGNNTAQLVCLYELWNKESGWRADIWNGDIVSAYEPAGSSGAYGIPQSLPFKKMPKAGWPTGYGGSNSPSAQIEWGLSYIHSTYSTPCDAWSHDSLDGSY
jgi:hypothetical protein